MGFSSNQQLLVAKDNVKAALTGQPIPHPTQINDDHRAQLTVYSEIAEILKISHKTVSIYKSRLYAKTGVKNLAQLILFSQKNMIFN